MRRCRTTASNARRGSDRRPRCRSTGRSPASAAARLLLARHERLVPQGRRRECREALLPQPKEAAIMTSISWCISWPARPPPPSPHRRSSPRRAAADVAAATRGMTFTTLARRRRRPRRRAHRRRASSTSRAPRRRSASRSRRSPSTTSSPAAATSPRSRVSSRTRRRAPIRTESLGAVRAASSTSPPKIICVGLNYRAHIAETGEKTPPFPDLFNKYNTTLNRHNGTVAVSQLPGVAVRLRVRARRSSSGKTGAQRPARRDALNYVFGYTTGNDFTARDAQNARVAVDDRARRRTSSRRSARGS